MQPSPRPSVPAVGSSSSGEGYNRDDEGAYRPKKLDFDTASDPYIQDNHTHVVHGACRGDRCCARTWSLAASPQEARASLGLSVL